mmetsp:Transcript_14407/g.31017  ORF Transcript_14407/g.31017 Transcript_14407/m.31017 type:complete len:120 (+) Transcript_14407:296-655(+)|eukprot:CAMPEP_0185853156 /NCGR_PEP_ID=MMETSP1354-20130828/17876_1 /TAXON_ID=708628 /ORGANISM="Erythrolobus madagascarensis, Strain CCMP3276" /LENGTH=119 /DNA_ID=CAMNT_0028554587 /DNA_START=275 /DNA_END=634 /DNA_ORIENTATION=-
MVRRCTQWRAAHAWNQVVTLTEEEQVEKMKNEKIFFGAEAERNTTANTSSLSVQEILSIMNEAGDDALDECFSERFDMQDNTRRTSGLSASSRASSSKSVTFNPSVKVRKYGMRKKSSS